MVCPGLDAPGKLFSRIVMINKNTILSRVNKDLSTVFTDIDSIISDVLLDITAKTDIYQKSLTLDVGSGSGKIAIPNNIKRIISVRNDTAGSYLECGIVADVNTGLGECKYYLAYNNYLHIGPRPLAGFKLTITYSALHEANSSAIYLDDCYLPLLLAGCRAMAALSKQMKSEYEAHNMIYTGLLNALAGASDITNAGGATMAEAARNATLHNDDIARKRRAEMADNAGITVSGGATVYNEF